MEYPLMPTDHLEITFLLGIDNLSLETISKSFIEFV